MGLASSRDSPLHTAVLQNDPQRVEELLASCGSANVFDADGRSPARLALDLGHIDVLKVLWKHGGKLLPELSENRCLLHEAVVRSDVNLLRNALKVGTTFQRLVNRQDAAGRTPLHLAAAAANPDLVALLLKYNSRTDIRDSEGRVPLDVAKLINSPAGCEVVEQLSMQDLMVKLVNVRRTKSLALDDRLRIAKGPAVDVRASHPDSLPKDLAQPIPKRPAAKLSPKGQGVFAQLEDAMKLSRLPVIKSEELQFEEMLSRGSSCIVFKGKWRGGEVAIKQFKTEYRTGKKELMKFVKEMMVLAQVRHPNLLLLMGICVDRPNLCLITEFVPNFSLFYTIHKNKSRKLTLSEKFEIAVQICKGLSYLHSNNPPILHRDLKPENCLLDHSLNVKIADFGLARPLTQFRTEETQDQTTTCIGTTRFMAPELFYKDQVSSIGVEVDIWALGCVLIELFSGRRPWDYISTSNSSSIYYEIFKQKPVPVPENIPTEVSAIITQCCNYATRRRPSATQVLEQLLLARSKHVE